MPTYSLMWVSQVRLRYRINYRSIRRERLSWFIHISRTGRTLYCHDVVKKKVNEDKQRSVIDNIKEDLQLRKTEHIHFKDEVVSCSLLQRQNCMDWSQLTSSTSSSPYRR